MLPVIGRQYARAFDGVRSQRVTRDSMSSFKGAGELEGEETRTVRAYFERVRSGTN
jgi:hypothetical protein